MKHETTELIKAGWQEYKRAKMFRESLENSTVAAFIFALGLLVMYLIRV